LKVTMKVLSYEDLIRLNENSIKAERRQNLKPEQIPLRPDREYIVNFRFDHEWNKQKDMRLSVILEPGKRTAWLDVSPEEFSLIREVQMSELEWEAAVCVGIPPWTP
jgi:hypothetical protein